MLAMANDSLETVNGSVVFINKNQRLMYDLKYSIRVICMDDFPCITNVDEYIGFLYGIISQDSDIETIYIDSILKHADISPDNLEDFLARLDHMSNLHGMDFVVSLSLDREEMGPYIDKYTVLN
jgi:hypothetical protein